MQVLHDDEKVKSPFTDFWKVSMLEMGRRREGRYIQGIVVPTQAFVASTEIGGTSTTQAVAI